MERTVKFEVDNIQKINFDDFSDEEFAIAKMGFLSTRPNSHGLVISEEVLRASAPSVLDKWVVADMFLGEATTHTDKESIVGRVPANQSVEFVEDEDGYLRAYVDTVISKLYAKDFCKMFETDNERAVSVEMKVSTEEDDENVVTSFNIMGVTVLGKTVNPSCPQSDITFVRFADDKATEFFNQHKDNLSSLKKFIRERKEQMAEKKTYKIDKSKESMSTADWGDVDKAAMRDKIMEASNRNTLVKVVYLLVEEGWEDAPSEHLKYPVMELKGDTFVYNRTALSSAMAYAKQHDEQAVIDKLKAIYKKLDLDDNEGKEEKKMSEIEFAAVDIGNLWCDLSRAMREKYPIGEYDCEYCIDGIYEESNQKFAIICDRNDAHYRLDFSLTEEGLTLAEEIVKVELEIVETEEVKKFAEPEDAEKYKTFAEPASEEETAPKEEKMSEEEMMAKIAQLEADIENRDNIIMEKDEAMAQCQAELSELKEFKASVMEKEKAMSVEAVMAEIKEFVDATQFEELRQEGLACNFAEVDAWANKAKAVSFESAKKNINKGKTDDVFKFAAPIESVKKSNSIWDKL